MSSEARSISSGVSALSETRIAEKSPGQPLSYPRSPKRMLPGVVSRRTYAT